MTCTTDPRDGAIVPDPQGIITGGHDNETARTVAIRRGEAINTRALAAMFEQITPTTAPAAGASSSATGSDEAIRRARGG